VADEKKLVLLTEKGFMLARRPAADPGNWWTMLVFGLLKWVPVAREPAVLKEQRLAERRSLGNDEATIDRMAEHR